MEPSSPPEGFLLSTSLPTTAQLAMAQDDAKSTLSSLDSANIETPSLNGTPIPMISAPIHLANHQSSTPVPYGLSTATTEILARMSAQPSTDYSVAREHILKSIVTSDKLPTLPPTKSGRGRGRPKGSGKRGGANAITPGADRMSLTMPLSSATGTLMTPSTQKRGARTRGGGRGRGGKRTGKRKREESDVSSLSDSEADGIKRETKNDGNESDDALTAPKVTKSGRAVHRPSQFVPVLPSPTTAGKKRKRTKRSTENAVCKACERGHSPNNNAIVFCDGCSTPYHQYCHTPPIEKEFIEIQDKEWLCAECTRNTADQPLDLHNLVSGRNLNEEEVCYLGIIC